MAFQRHPGTSSVPFRIHACDSYFTLLQKAPVKPDPTYKGGTLLFVWNADGGWLHGLMDSLHKWLSPQTYGCDLCKLTHGVAGSKKAWKDFLEGCGRPVSFMHRDAYEKSAIYPGPGQGLPLVLEYREGVWGLLMSAEEIGKKRTLGALIEGLEKALERD